MNLSSTINALNKIVLVDAIILIYVDVSPARLSQYHSVRCREDISRLIRHGRVPERTNGTVLKTVVAKVTVGSNPTPSAKWRNYD